MTQQITLEDKYTAREGRVYLTGSQALVRLPMMQRQRDLAAGLNTAGFISGYRGSPLGIYDLALWQAQKHLQENHIVFQPGVNEDLAATAVWGSQQVNRLGESLYDGVFAMWYGKGPGVDRSGDALKHGSYAGAAEHGGVLVLCGDDHAARSSTVAHQSDHALIHFGIPILNPADLQDYLDLGLLGFAMSRYSGAWIGFKCVTDTVESSASVDARIDRLMIRTPEDFEVPPSGLNLQLGVMPLVAERRQLEQRMAAVQAFARANGIDRRAIGRADGNRLGIITTGKAYLDVIEALRQLGVHDEAEAFGVAVYKVGMVWPLEPQGIRAFAAGCSEVLVIEEKRPVIEEQLAHILYNLATDARPRLSGKKDIDGTALVSQTGELAPAMVAHAIYQRLMSAGLAPEQLARINPPDGMTVAAPAATGLVRMPSFCAGCPHNTSTRVPDGSIAMGGIGCHGLATWLPERKTVTLYHMGGEGAPWIGQAPFLKRKHIFQNLGDGTYFHSGLLAVRACVAANVNITYKILLNGAIAMTGGQPIEGESFDSGITAPRVAAQLIAEGVRKVAIVSDDISRHDPAHFPPEVAFHHRDDLDRVQREMRELEGVTAIVYDQSCATERRRLRKRGKIEDPNVRLLINSDVCEGCGDCGIQSNCVALEPIETDLGRKRRINQSVCNKDISCLKGLCPSFVTVKGGRLRTRQPAAVQSLEAYSGNDLPEPDIRQAGPVYSILVAGIGGNGVVTVGAILGMAAHLDQRGVSVLDMSGLAQRNGPVTSHVRLTDGSGSHAPRIPERAADLVIGCDLVVASSAESLSRMDARRTAVVYNRFVAPTSAFATNPDLDFSDQRLAEAIARQADPDQMTGVDATAVAMARLGDAIGANLFLVGLAWQKGLIPIRRESLEQAIRLNGTAVDLNMRAFLFGRMAAVRPAQVEEWLSRGTTRAMTTAETLEDVIGVRQRLLREYQDDRLVRRYQALVERVRQAETELTGTAGALTMAVAKAYANVLYHKDEYEVARLYSSERFRDQLAAQFEGDFTIEFNLAPPLLARRGSDGRPRKVRFGSWMRHGFAVLSKLKGLRGGPLDVFGYLPHRKMERQLGAEYEALVDKLLAGLRADRLAQAAKIAESYARVKGYDVVKEAKLAEVRASVAEALADYEAAPHLAA
ncbi:MAG TPA: indolepyruvate ferredoxin oxidoreductase family protein [Pedomonas sp.]|uniref:indolepyruvate ferredoxin oxidoreductase family protein n=1 Tax=Pedomonas sp. TaxID=2976421 RepID=UPI002F3E83B6